MRHPWSGADSTLDRPFGDTFTPINYANAIKGEKMFRYCQGCLNGEKKVRITIYKVTGGTLEVPQVGKYLQSTYSSTGTHVSYDFYFCLPSLPSRPHYNIFYFLFYFIFIILLRQYCI